ncbi:unnamed protein product [Cercospora beticola]|nr:unnamed protein product [Cercospora beticola]
MMDSRPPNESTPEENEAFWDRRCQFSKLQCYKKSNLAMHSLTNPISELFSKELFSIEDSKERTAISDQTYAKLAPSLRLASRMIYSPLLIPFWSTLLLKQPSYWEDRCNPNNYGMQYSFDQFNPERPISKEIRQATRSQLDTLHNYVQYVITDRTNSFCTEQQGAHDVTVPGIPNGYRSEIWISTRKINDLVTATINASDVPALLFYRFRLALGILHELAHAAWNKVNGKIDFEPFFGNESISELGFELERQLFDGRLDLLYENVPLSDDAKYFKVHRYSGRISALRGYLVLWEHPSQDIIEEYRGMSCLQVRMEDNEKQKCNLAWQVKLDHFEKFFKDEFWTSKACEDKKNWHPPREIGYTFRRTVKEPEEAKDGKEAKEGTDVTEPIARAVDEHNYLLQDRGCNYRRGTYGEIILPSQSPIPIANLTKSNYEHAAANDPGKLPWLSSHHQVELYTGLTDRQINLHKRRDLLCKLHLAVRGTSVDIARFEGDAMEYRAATRMVPLLECIAELERQHNSRKGDYLRVPNSPLIKRPGQSAVDVEVLIHLLRDLERLRIESLEADASWGASNEERRRIFEEPEIDAAPLEPMELVQASTPPWHNRLMSPEHGPTPSPLTPAVRRPSGQRQHSAQDVSSESARRFLFPQIPAVPQSAPRTPQGLRSGTAGMKSNSRDASFTSVYPPIFSSPHGSGSVFESTGYTVPTPGLFNESPVTQDKSSSRYVPAGPMTPQRRPRAVPTQTPGLTPDSTRTPGMRTPQVPRGLSSVLHRNKRMNIGRGKGLTTAQEEDESHEDELDESPKRPMRRRKKAKQQKQDEEVGDVEMEDSGI